MIRELFNLLSILLVVSMVVFTVTPLSAYADTFQEVLKYANSLRDTVQKETAKFNPQEVFKDQKGGYTDNPSQANYYQEVKSENSQTLKTAAVAEVVKDDNKDADGKIIPNPGKVVTKAFSEREVFKITAEDKYIKDSKLIVDNAQNIITGVSNKDVDCQDRKISTCNTSYVEKSCNEEVRTTKRVCDRVPKITTSVERTVYPNCKNMVVAQTYQGGCPSGYKSIFNTDMIRWETWDDISLCIKSIPDGQAQECYIGYLVHSGYPGDTTSTGKATVPKKMHGRIRFSNTYRGNIIVTIINETTGETLYDKGSFSGGQVIELPFSEDRDQTFKFYYDPKKVWWWSNGGMGAMVLYVDHIHEEKVANFESWEEVNCHEI